jgi:hypothetical protein
MDPFSGIAALGARYGVKKIAQAFLCEGAEAELADGLVGLMLAAEQSQARLAEIEQRLDVLVEQRYHVASRMGRRYLQQALLADRAEENRRADLDHAEAQLVEAAEASVTPLQQALAERLLVVARFAKGDRPAAADSQLRFDLALGEAAHQESTLLRPIASRRNERFSRLVSGRELTAREALKEAFERARGSWFASTRRDHVGEGPFMLLSDEQEVQPGATARIDLHEVERNHPPTGDWPEEISVDVSGMSFVARRG